jgi:hypothetical protein
MDEAKEHAQKTLVEKGMLTDEFEDNKHSKNFSKIMRNLQAEAFLQNHESTLISNASTQAT